MNTQQEFGIQGVLGHAISSMAQAISMRPGEGKQEQFVRAGIAAATILEFRPLNVPQVLLAGHCVMLHEVLTASVRDTLHGEHEKMRRSTRSNIVAMNQAFHLNLDKLDEYQTQAARSDILQNNLVATQGDPEPDQPESEAAGLQDNPSMSSPEPTRTQTGPQPAAMPEIRRSPDASEGRHPNPPRQAGDTANAGRMAASNAMAMRPTNVRTASTA